MKAKAGAAHVKTVEGRVGLVDGDAAVGQVDKQDFAMVAVGHKNILHRLMSRKLLVDGLCHR